jgi:hypothetical protein
VTIIEQGSGNGKPGTTVDLGSFSYTPGGAGLIGAAKPALDGVPAEQMLSSVTISVSRPKIFSSLTITALINGDTVETSTVNAPDIADSTVFAFTSPITLEDAETVTFDLSGVISGGKSAELELPVKVRLAGVITGGSRPNGFGGTGNLMFALSLFGFVTAPLTSTRQRRRVSMLAAAMIVLATVMAGCGSSSGGAPSTSASTQEVTGVDVTQGGSTVEVSGLPVDLGKIRKQ